MTLLSSTTQLIHPRRGRGLETLMKDPVLVKPSGVAIDRQTEVKVMYFDPSTLEFERKSGDSKNIYLVPQE
jgi:hypothetical protein